MGDIRQAGATGSLAPSSDGGWYSHSNKEEGPSLVRAITLGNRKKIGRYDP
jgi:hypothetical protein